MNAIGMPGANLMERWAGSFDRVARAAAGWVVRELTRRQDQRYLEEAPDYILKDIGIHRSEVRAITRLGREAYRRSRAA